MEGQDEALCDQEDPKEKRGRDWDREAQLPLLTAPVSQPTPPSTGRE